MRCPGHPAEEVDDRLHKIMIATHKTCYETAEMYGTPGNLVNGANIGGFLKVTNAMLDQGSGVGRAGSVAVAVIRSGVGASPPRTFAAQPGLPSNPTHCPRRTKSAFIQSLNIPDML